VDTSTDEKDCCCEELGRLADLFYVFASAALTAAHGGKLISTEETVRRQLELDNANKKD